MLCRCVLRFCFLFFKQKTAYEMRISDWSSDVCSSDLPVATREMREEIFLQRGEMRRRHRHIGLAPPDSVGGLRILDDELVLGAAAGVLAGGDDEWTVLGQQSFAVTDRFLDQPQIGRAHV